MNQTSGFGSLLYATGANRSQTGLRNLYGDIVSEVSYVSRIKNFNWLRNLLLQHFTLSGTK